MICMLTFRKTAQHSAHRTPAKYAGAGGGSHRAFKPFIWLEVGPVKVALSRLVHQRVTKTVGLLKKAFVTILSTGEP